MSAVVLLGCAHVSWQLPLDAPFRRNPYFEEKFLREAACQAVLVPDGSRGLRGLPEGPTALPATCPNVFAQDRLVAVEYRRTMSCAKKRTPPSAELPTWEGRAGAPDQDPSGGGAAAGRTQFDERDAPAWPNRGRRSA